MLLESGDLIPVLSHAVEIPWTRRKNQIMGFLYRGRVTFQTMVYDSNVGDISPLSTYFNPRKWTVEDLNQKFGQIYVEEDYRTESSAYIASNCSETANAVNPDFRNDVKSAALTPRLILFTEKQTFENRPDPRQNAYHQATDTFCNFPTIGFWNHLPPPFTPPTLTLSTPLSLTSKLPSPPNKSPEFQVSEDTFEPIEPPKRRRLLSNNELKKFNEVTKVTKRPASTSSAWTPWISNETLSPFLNVALESAPNNVFTYDFDEEDDDDDLKGVCDEQTLVQSLRKIAKAFESEDW
jgi:hypothetical protein